MIVKYICTYVITVGFLQIYGQNADLNTEFAQLKSPKTISSSTLGKLYDKDDSLSQDFGESLLAINKLKEMLTELESNLLSGEKYKVCN